MRASLAVLAGAASQKDLGRPGRAQDGERTTAKARGIKSPTTAKSRISSSGSPGLRTKRWHRLAWRRLGSGRVLRVGILVLAEEKMRAEMMQKFAEDSSE